jgi:hypothetical protein
MKTCALLYLVIIKLLSATGQITPSTNFSTNMPSTISCYAKCGLAQKLPTTFDQATTLHDLPHCINSKYTKRIDPNKKSCALSVMAGDSMPFFSRPDKNIILLAYSVMDKKDCEEAKSIQFNTACLHSTCPALIVCCEENLCNTANNFNLKMLKLYAHSDDDKKSTNSYSKYTDRKCRIKGLKSKKTALMQPCLVSYHPKTNNNHDPHHAINRAPSFVHKNSSKIKRINIHPNNITMHLYKNNTKKTPPNASYTIKIDLAKYLLISFILYYYHAITI